MSNKTIFDLKPDDIDWQRGFDDDYYLLGYHLTLEEARMLWEKSEYDPDEEVVAVDHLWVRHGMLPEDTREEDGQRGWWVVDAPGRGVGKATAVTLKRLPDE